MIPIVGGVVLLTFLLFNVVGGSPAALVLGKNASARALEEFDDQFGYNKPLLWGRWVSTRAFQDAHWGAGRPAPAWVADGDTVRQTPDGLTLTAPASLRLPLAFALQPDTCYRWNLEYKTEGASRAGLLIKSQSNIISRLDLPAGTAWQQARLEVTIPTAVAGLEFELAVETGALTLRRAALARRCAHPWDSRLARYLGRLARGDLGVSTETNARVASLLKAGAGPSLALSVPILLGGLAAALVLALVCAYYRNRAVDRIVVIAATAMMSINYIIWIVAGQYLLAFKLGWFPIWGYESWAYLLLPVGVGIVSGLGRDVRFYRTVLLDEMYKDYVRTAVAKGVAPRGVMFRHVLRNALLPVITNVSMALPFLFTGNLLLESYFGIPGLGGLSINAINANDLDVVQAVVLVGALLYVVSNLLTDIGYAWADPRVRLE